MIYKIDGSSAVFGPVDSDGASIEESQVDQEPSELRYNGFIANFENLVAVEVNGNVIELR